MPFLTSSREIIHYPSFDHWLLWGWMMFVC